MNVNPLLLIAEITHLCPLKCLYCSNPIALARRSDELDTEGWRRVLTQSAELGVKQVSFTGGEPCLRADLAELIGHASKGGLYVNLITSGVGVSESTLDELVAAGTSHIQLSFQDSHTLSAKETCGVDALAKKKQFAHWLAKRPVAFTANLVIHRQNHARLQEMIDMAVGFGAGKIEVAHVQFNGWALKNRARLLPSREMVQESLRLITLNKERLKGHVRIDHVLPDYYADLPKACMGGWATKMILVNPRGQALPCHSAETIPGFPIPDVRNSSLAEIWRSSELFNAFRGEDWMKEPCRTCEHKRRDFGGCRCQALALAGDAREADPVCRKSGFRARIDEFLERREEQVAPAAYRA